MSDATEQPTVIIESRLEVHRCEDCGSYEVGTVRVTLPNGRILRAHHDGHFGEACWTGELCQVHFWCLQALGVELRVNGEPVTESPYQERAEAEGSSWRVVDLLPAERETVDLALVNEPDPECPEWSSPVSVSWVSPDGLRQIAHARPGAGLPPPSWDGGVSSLYERILRERVTLVQQELRDDID